MKKGYSVKNICHVKTADSICVDNYNGINQIVNYWYNLLSLKDLKNKNTIGVWKIKKLN